MWEKRPGRSKLISFEMSYLCQCLPIIYLSTAYCVIDTVNKFRYFWSELSIASIFIERSYSLTFCCCEWKKWSFDYISSKFIVAKVFVIVNRSFIFNILQNIISIVTIKTICWLSYLCIRFSEILWIDSLTLNVFSFRTSSKDSLYSLLCIILCFKINFYKY